MGLVLLAVLFGVDFHLDTRDRDALSWMDPYQYYELARDMLTGLRGFDGFEVPSLFPFLLVPLLALRSSLAAALWINFASTLLLVWSLHRLCRQLEIRTASPLVAALVLSSPLLVGLSRTLYVEYTLTALVSMAFLLWLRFARAMDWRSGLAFGLVSGLGFMTKMTFPLFLLPPVVGAVIARLARRRRADAVVLAAALLVPIAVAMIIQLTVFPGSAGYYLSLGNTRLSIMALIGPPEWLSWPSLGFYFVALARSLLGLLTPLLLLALWSAWRGRKLGWRGLDSSTAALWLWLIGPLLLLVSQPVKEPRHVAACVVPAVLLGVLGIEGLRRGRGALTAAALLLAALQFGAVTTGRVEAPYFLDRALHVEALREHMLRATAGGLHRRTPAAARVLHWKYAQNVAIAGFPANEALALTWQMFPGVVFDLDGFAEAERFSDRLPYERFEDLYLLSAFNAYNRRCGWHRYYRTLTREQVIANADFVIVNDSEGSRWLEFPEHRLVATIAREPGSMRILAAPGSTTPYRVLYARRFLQRNPELGDEEARVVANELLLAAVLGGDERSARSLTDEFPLLRDKQPLARNIYWIGGYGSLIQLADRMLERGQRDGP